MPFFRQKQLPLFLTLQKAVLLSINLYPMLDWRKIGICLVLLATFLGFQWFLPAEGKATFHSTQEIHFFTTVADTLPGGYNSLFAASGECQDCHGLDTAMIASVDIAGNDINVVDDWKATMMANSAKDPFWRAKVSHETLLYPEHQAEIETKCTSCHAPMGHFAAFHDGATQYTIADMIQDDSMAMDGVSCLACHQQADVNLAANHSGNLVFDTARVAFGPFISPLSSPMANATGYMPVFSPHISDAGLCAGCHTLITETLDYEGNFTGDEFVEQATYQEWVNSRYNLENISCQNCHLPKISKGTFYLVNDLETEPRDEFYLHDLVGANTTMLKLMRDNIETLGITAEAEQFDEVIAKTEELLRFQSLDLTLTALERTVDTAFLKVHLLNKAGHKFPSGYPSRRAFVQVVVQNLAGDTLFISGKWDENYELLAQNPDFEPHYTTIRDESEAQIYEFVFGDVNSDVTTVLERGYITLKDNRIPPQGFVTKHASYDTVQIVGNALNDNNFNRQEGLQGTGTDDIFYHVPLQGFPEEIIATAKVYYQATPPKWMQEMFDETSEEIELFRGQFEAADRSPFLMVEDTVHLAGVNSLTNIPTEKINAFAIGNQRIQVELGAAQQVQIVDINGQILDEYHLPKGEHQIRTNRAQEVIFVRFTNKNNQQVRKIWVW